MLDVNASHRDAFLEFREGLKTFVLVDIVEVCHYTFSILRCLWEREWYIRQLSGLWNREAMVDQGFGKRA